VVGGRVWCRSGVEGLSVRDVVVCVWAGDHECRRGEARG